MPADGPSTPPTSPLGGALITPKDLHAISEAQEKARLKEAQDLAKKQQEEQTAIHEAFMHQHIRPDAKERFTHAVRAAAERGETEIEIVRFPSSYCSDGGRSINNFEPDWPDSLTGFAREVYDNYDRYLRPAGYKLRAQILSYPGGMPGDVGVFLHW
ncbi:hypothetical protein Sp245p_30220 (plasmid) [Azospirillum baldaniorum]|uniref:Uncharacterized protein n=1 Tax=Azospirillum baldaniorum TaxID=1064539 RepID=A0A9P1NQ17_9PROT|nr:hypothetical protein [Azospirillum baldaniorum]AWJ94081.1 hypothetical protein Sp245p_30220 [Azospirillum baldaniorum]TWA81920.1 hypothetical protein FBZ85_102294 [Azospirillum brasilense]CCD01386.1 conserved protein of unknown function [Azospirillum baldaniorum]